MDTGGGFYWEMLERVRASMGAPPRRRILDSERVKAPGRVRRHHPALADLAKRQNILLREGDIVWGAVVQANRAMFAPGWFNYAGSMLYSRDEAISATPHILLTAVEDIYAAKGRRGLDAEMQAIADMLYFGSAAEDLRVPLDITRGIQCYITNVVFDRSHLPRGMLDVKLMPILIDPRMSAVMVVPYWHWPKALRAPHPREVHA